MIMKLNHLSLIFLLYINEWFGTSYTLPSNSNSLIIIMLFPAPFYPQVCHESGTLLSSLLLCKVL